MEEQVLDEGFHPDQLRRRQLLPLWIRIFIWLFLLAGIAAVLGFVMGFFGMPGMLAIYGFETGDFHSSIGLMILGVFLIKGIVAYGLWWERKWAVSLAMFDAIIGIVICVYEMTLDGPGHEEFMFRLEILVLIPYFIKMFRIRSIWEKIELVS